MVNIIGVIGISILLVVIVPIFEACLIDVTESIEELHWDSFSKDDIEEIVKKENE